MRVANRGIDAFSKLIACAYVKVVANKIATSAGCVTIESGVRACAGVAIEKVIKAVCAACKPVPAVAAVYTQVLGWLKLQLYLWRLDILEYDVVVRRPGPRKTKEAFKAVVYVVIGIPVSGCVAIKRADPWFPARA